MKRGKKILTRLKKNIPFMIFVVMGFFCGLLIGKYIDVIQRKNASIGENIFTFVILIAGMCIAILLQTVIHEAGHMIFGLLTGYRFSSFRIGSFMVIKKEGHMKFCRFSLAGTGGQCLLVPPEMKEGKVPYVLYNLGGSLVNLVSAILFSAIAYFCFEKGAMYVFFQMLAIIGLADALVNGIPFQLGEINNDGYNALSLGKSPEALRALWIELKINEQNARGIRLKNMPEEWFEVPTDESLKNAMVSDLSVFACNRLMDQKRFEEAVSEMKRLLSLKTGIVGVYRNLMINDLIYCEVIGENNPERLEKMLDKQQQKFMKVMKKFPSILRTDYVYALLAEHNEGKAQKIKDDFNKMAKHYPYMSDIESERELMDYAEKIWRSHL